MCFEERTSLFTISNKSREVVFRFMALFTMNWKTADLYKYEKNTSSAYSGFLPAAFD